MAPVMPPPTVRELLDAARSWCAANYPGCPLEQVSLTLRYLTVPITLADSPTALAQPVAEASGRPGLDACTSDILAALTAKGPLTKSLLIAELAERNRRGEAGEYSPSTIERRLALLMEDETIENPRGAKPPGYRLNR